MANAVLRFAPPFLVLRDARGFFQIGAQGIGLGFHQFGNHALFDDRVAARAEARAEEDVGDVSTPAARAVQGIGGLRVAADFAADGELRIGGELAAHAAIAIVEDQLDGGEGGGLARGGAVEDDVGQCFAAQLAGGAFAHHPAHGVDDVRFAAAVRPDHRVAIARQNNRRGIHEGLEPDELDFLEPHGSRLPVRSPINDLLIAVQGEPPSASQVEKVEKVENVSRRRPRQATHARPTAGVCHTLSHAIFEAVHYDSSVVA